MRAYLAISLIGKDRPGIVDDVSGRLNRKGFNIEESRMAVLGGEFGLIMLSSGPTEQIDVVRASLAELEGDGFLVTIKETTEPIATRGDQARVPYTIKVYGMDHEGIVHAFAAAMAAREINVEELETASYDAPLSGAVLFSMELIVAVPATVRPRELRELIHRLGDEHGVDASLAPAE